MYFNVIHFEIGKIKTIQFTIDKLLFPISQRSKFKNIRPRN